MGIVIGPIARDDWYLMRQLRESINDMKSINSVKYKTAIDIHSKLYKRCLEDAVTGMRK